MSIQDPSDYKTGDAVPSNKAMDLNDNAKVFDVFQNAQVPSVKSRLGVQIKTIWQQGQDFIEASNARDKTFDAQFMFKRIKSFADAHAAGEKITDATRLNSYSTGAGDSIEWWGLIQSTTIPPEGLPIPSEPDDNWSLVSSLSVDYFYSNLFSSVGLHFSGFWKPNDSIPAKSDRVDGYAKWETASGKIIIPKKDEAFTTANTFQLDNTNWSGHIICSDLKTLINPVTGNDLTGYEAVFVNGTQYPLIGAISGTIESILFQANPTITVGGVEYLLCDAEHFVKDNLNSKACRLLTDGSNQNATLLTVFNSLKALGGGTLEITEGTISVLNEFIVNDLDNITIYSKNKDICKIQIDDDFCIRGAKNTYFKNIGWLGTLTDSKTSWIVATAYTDFGFYDCDFSNWGAKASIVDGSSIVRMYATQADSHQHKGGNSTRGKFINCSMNGNGRLCNFGLRLLTDFSPYTTTATNTENTVENLQADEFSWNAFECAGPNTYANNISNIRGKNNGLSLFDIDKGSHDNLVTGLHIDGLLGNIDVATEPNTSITGVLIQGTNPTTEYAYKNIISDVNIRLYKEHLDAYPNRVSIVAVANCKENLITDVKYTIRGGTVARKDGKKWAIAQISHTSSNGNVFKNIRGTGATSGICQSAINNAAMNTNAINRVIDCSDDLTMTGEVILALEGVQGGTSAFRWTFDNVTYTSDMSDPYATWLTEKPLIAATISGTSTNVMIVRKNSRISTTNDQATLARCNIERFALLSVTAQGFTDARLLQGGANLEQLAIDDINVNNGNVVDVAQALKNISSGVKLFGGMNTDGIGVHRNITLMSGANGDTPNITISPANVSYAIKFERINKVQGSHSAWYKLSNNSWGKTGVIS